MRFLEKLTRYFLDVDAIDAFETEQNTDFASMNSQVQQDSEQYQEVRKAIAQIMTESFHHIPVETTDIMDANLLDSMEVMSLSVLLSEAFDVEISYKELRPECFNSVDLMTQMILKLKLEKQQDVEEDFSMETEREPILDILWSEAEKPVVQRVIESAIKEPNARALVINDTITTYGELQAKIQGAGEFLAAQGVKENDCVVLQAKCEVDYIAALFATHLCRATAVPVENTIGVDRLTEIATETKAAVILTEPNLKPAEAKPGLTWLSYDDVDFIPHADTKEYQYPDLNADSLILYTTGSTGKSKGVIMPHKSNAWLCVAYPKSNNLRQHARVLTSYPLNHTAGIYTFMHILANGGTLILVDGMKNMDIFFTYFKKYHPSKLSLPPMAWQMLIRFGRKTLADIGMYVDDITFGSEPMPLSVLQEMQQLFPNADMRNIYGCTELAYLTHAKLQVGEAEVPLGVTFEGVEVALMDEEGHISAEAGRTGQICFKSQMVMRGYFNQPDLTASSFTDGWFVMSDIGYLDENRVLYFRGRAGDVITIAGYKIAPTEVEDAARASGMLEECICIKGMSKDGLPFLRLLVVPKKPAEFSDTVLRAYLSDHLETYRVPSAIDVVESIQRNVNGKLDRKYYRSMEQA